MAMIDLAYVLGLGEEDFSNIIANSARAYLLREASACSNLNDRKKILTYSYCVKYQCTINGSSVSFEGGINRSLLTKEKIEEDSTLIDFLDQNMEKTVQFTAEDEIYSRMELSDVIDKIGESLIPEFEGIITSALGGA